MKSGWEDDLFRWEDDQMNEDADTDVENDALDSLVDRWEELTACFGKRSTLTDLDIALMHEDVHQVVAVVESSREQIPGETANRCLIECMKDATVEEYRTLLCALPSGEYAGSCAVDVDWSAPRKWMVDDLRLQVTGTLVSLAVALDRSDILQILLERGHDVNGASFSAASALVHFTGDRLDDFNMRSDTLHGLSRIQFYGALRYRERWLQSGMEYTSVTPLALAVLMGREECVRILLDHGAWMENNASVSRMMHLAWREKDKRYQSAREAVLSHGDASSHRPILSGMIESSLAQFRAALKAYSYTREDFDQMLDEISCTAQSFRVGIFGAAQDWQKVCGKLREIGKCCPAALSGRRGMRAIMSCSDMNGFSLAPLLPFLAGRKVDITDVSWVNMKVLECKKLLAELSESCEPVADRYEIKIPIATVERVKALLKYVTFYFEKRTRRISELTDAILRCGNTKLTRSALENGIIRESAKDILCWMRERCYAEVCREAVLTTRRDKTQLLEDWEGADEDCKTEFEMPTKINVSGMEIWCNPLIAACLTGDVDAVRDHMGRSNVEMRYYCGVDSAIHSFGMSEAFNATALCAAALGGQNAVIELLLDEFSAPVEEWSEGIYSVWCAAFDAMLLEPVVAAAIGGHWDTVKLLLERGACPHWDDPYIREFWRKYGETDLSDQVRVHIGDWAVTR